MKDALAYPISKRVRAFVDCGFCFFILITLKAATAITIPLLFLVLTIEGFNNKTVTQQT